MNKTLRIYIVLIALVLAAGSALAEDMLDSYIKNFIAKSEIKSDKLLQMVDDSELTQVFKADNTADVQQTHESESVNKDQLDKTKILRDELKKTSIMALPNGGESNINSQLQNVLSQLKSLSFSEMPEVVELESEGQQPEPVVSEVQVEVIEVVEIVSADTDESPVAEQNIQLVAKLPDDTSGVVDSFELAESLFHIDDKPNALRFYRKSFSLSLPTGNKPNPKRAWILFQVGNCLYSDDSVEAIKIYEQLIIEHPSSDWTNCARTKLQVLKWLQAEKPMALTMSEVK